MRPPGGFAPGDGSLLVRRVIDAQGKSRAWINGSAATMTQLREVAEHLVDIHGQHAWQGLTRPASVRALLDGQAGVDGAVLTQRWQAWRVAQASLDDARARRDTLERERERLVWQIGEVDKLAPGDDEWGLLNAEHQRLAHGQALLDGARAALDVLSEGEPAVDAMLARALDALDDVARYDGEIAAVVEVLRATQAQAQDAAHSLHAYLGRREPDPQRLAELDQRLAAWVALARRYRRTPAELPALLASWKDELKRLDAAADLDSLERGCQAAQDAWRAEARRVSALRAQAAPRLAAAVTRVMQQLGMAGGRFEVALLPQDEPQSFGLESVELRVAGHAGSTPRALAKVASGGELSRLALAIAVTTAGAAGAAEAPDAGAASLRGGAPTLIFDEIDSGVGGTVADAVGALMQRLGRSTQVLAVTHLAQVAAAADVQVSVAKTVREGRTLAAASPISGEERVSEIARMLSGSATDSALDHARELLDR